MNLIFVFSHLILGILVGFFSMRIFLDTKGRSRGWRYLGISGLFVFLWTVALTILTPLGFISLKLLISSICWLVIGTIFPLGLIILGLDLGKRMHPFFHTKPFLSTVVFLWTLLIFINIIVLPYDSLLLEIAGISRIVMAITFLVTALLPVFLLWRDSLSWAWFMMLLFVIIMPISVIMGSYANGCCLREGQTYQSLCKDLSIQYADTLYPPCNAQLLSISYFYIYLETMSYIFFGLALFGLWRTNR